MPRNAGSSYGTTFIHPDFVAARWNRSPFKVVDVLPAGLRGWQDIVVLRRATEP